jgi:hypothetical protein
MFNQEKHNDQWCCLGFQGAYELAGQRGLGIVVCRENALSCVFRLQFRAVEQGAESKISVPRGVSLSYVSEAGLQFCPWCGSRLSEFYGSRICDLYRSGIAIEST